MADPIVHITNGIPDSGTGNITTLGQTLTDGANATLGATTGLAVTTNTTGTIQQYLRGFVSLFSGSIFSGQNQASPANTQLVGAQFNTTPTTVVTGNSSPLQMDSSGNLLVNVKAGGGAGGTSSTFGSAFPATGTAVGFTDGTNMRAGVIKAASTPPVPADPAIVVAISPNSVNSNGQAAMTNSAPVAIASNQSTLAVAQDTSQIANGVSGTMLTQAAKPATASSSGATSVIPLVSAKKIRILSAYITANGAVNFNFQSHTTTSNKTGLTYCAAAGDGLVLPFNPMGWFDTTAGEALDINLSGAVAVDGYINYVAV